jgi:protein subunit release factor B
MNTILHLSSGRGPVEVRTFLHKLHKFILEECKSHGIATHAPIQRSQSGDERSLEIELALREGEIPAWIRDLVGTHELVARSPLRSRSARKRWFVALTLRSKFPAAEAKFDPRDLRLQFIRSSGPGGQNVNKSSSAVRATHVPSGTSVVVRTTRSQTVNRCQAILHLHRQRHREHEDRERRAREKQHAQAQNVERGNPVRRYVLDSRDNLMILYNNASQQARRQEGDTST